MLIVGDSGPFEIVIAVVAVGFVALAIDRLVSEFRGWNAPLWLDR